MSRWIRLAALTAGLLGLSVSAGAARQVAQSIEDYYGRTVTDIRFEIDGPGVAPPSLPGLIDVRVGQPLTREAVRDSIGHLAVRYEQVSVLVTNAPSGLVVTFRLVPRYPINRIEVSSGEPCASDSALRAELTQQFVGLSTGLRLASVEEAARRVLNDAGCLSADVTATTRVEPDAPRATLVVSVMPGPVTLIGRSEVTGSTLIPPADVIRRTETQSGKPFRRREIDTRLTELEDDLRDRGHYAAQVTLDARPVASGMDVTIDIDAGPLVRVRVEPPNALPGRLDELIPVKRLRSADQDLLEDARGAIERELRKDGYANAEAPFSSELSADGSVLVITFRIARGPRFYVERIDPPASSELPLSVVHERLGLEQGDLFNQDAFNAGMNRLTEDYRRLGYYRAEADPRREVVAGRSSTNQAWVILTPSIKPGPKGTVTDITFQFVGEHTVSDTELKSRLRSKVGGPYVEADVIADHEALNAFYGERGFLSKSVALSPRVSEDGTNIVLAFTVNEGPKVVVGRITVTGNSRVSEQQILEVLALVPGQPLSETTRDDARQRLFDMGVFRNVSVAAEDLLSGEDQAHIVVNVNEAPTISGSYGGGIEGGSRPRSAPAGSGALEDHIDLAPRGFFEITRRNLGGRNRSLTFFSRVSLKPPSTPEVPETDARGFGFAEYRVSATYRERRAFHSNTDLLLGLTTERAVRSSYTSLRRGANAELLRRPTTHTTLSGRYGLDFTRLFDVRIKPEDQPLIDRLFPQVRLSFVGAGVAWDGRDNLLAPTRGHFLTADTELALRAIGSEVGYFKIFLQGSSFRSLTTGGATVLAMRAETGLAWGFSRTVTETRADGSSATSTIQDLPVSQRFFAGGGNTVRGFQYDRLGELNPDCEPTPLTVCSVIDPRTGLSLGGNSTVVLNAEVRRILTKLAGKNLAVAGFLDAGNVFLKASDLDLTKIRGAAGFGVRWDSPLGPLRLDFGFKLDRLFVAGKKESAWEYHLSIGEAF